jgi:tripartite-type tricarboxylate transporter receptor subunit TctC
MKFLSAAAGLAVILASAPAAAQAAPSASKDSTYPVKPLRLVVPFAAGSTVDTLARLVAQKLTENWGQQAVVDNRSGAGGVIGTDMAAKAAPDGYTLLMAAGSHAINPSLYRKLPYDTVKDFAPVTLVASAPMVVYAHPSVHAASIGELIALAKSKPGQIHYASGGNGSPSHLTMERFRAMAGIDLVHVPYKGGGTIFTALLSGEVQLHAGSMLGLMPQVKAGKLKALAVTGERRSPAAADLPTVAESGLPGFAASGWWGLLLPAGTPKALVTRLHREVVRVLQAPDVRERLAANGIDPVGNNPDEFAAYIRQEMAIWSKVVKDAGLRAE